MQDKNSWFERHPKTTILSFSIILVLGLVFLSEMILSIKAGNQEVNHGIKRYIRLKEHNPFFSHTISLLKKDRNVKYDSLEDKKYPLRVDENGFIIPSKIHDNPELTLVFLGGSTTECRFVSEKVRYPYLVGRILENKSGLKINSFNSGVSGNDSIHSIDILLNKVLPINPNIVVMMHNVNDLSTLMLEKSYWNNNPTRSVIVRESNNFIEPTLWKLKNMLVPNLYDAIKSVLPKGKRPGEFDRLIGRKITIDKKYLLQEFKDNLRIFINIAKIKGITPVLMTQANRLKEQPDELVKKLIAPLHDNYDISYKDYKEIYDLFNQAIRDVGQENSVLVIDLAAKVPQEKEFIYDIAHYNDKGSEYVAKIISEKLLSLMKK